MRQGTVAFIAAPYGYGPSSKAVAISSYLPQSIQRLFLGFGPALDLARRSNLFSSCFELDFESPIEYVAQRLAPYDVLIFINSTRFISELTVKNSMSILVETLAWLREAPPLCSPLLSAYYAQRFFHHPFAPKLEAMDNFCAVGAILPASILAASNAARRPALHPRSPLVHCGGLFSPAMVKGAEQDFVSQTFNAMNSLNEPIRAILPARLHCLFQTKNTEEISLLDCSPLSVYEHIIGSEFCLTTTGIEFTYEIVALGVPTLFLPPFNASQYYQLEYHRRAGVECIPFKTDAMPFSAGISALHESTTVLQEIGMRGLWSVQFAEVACFLDRLRKKERGALLQKVLDAQQKEIGGIANDGAKVIALHILRELGMEVSFQ